MAYDIYYENFGQFRVYKKGWQNLFNLKEEE